MGYAIHIEKENGAISLEEWVSAVNMTDGARIASGGVEAINPTTGELIKIRGNPGDVEVLEYYGGFMGFGRKSRWIYAIRFFKGRALFNATINIESPNNSVHVVVAKLARLLSAKIVGDDGEEYSW
jgi:hypothetical protein